MPQMLPQHTFGLGRFAIHPAGLWHARVTPFLMRCLRQDSPPPTPSPPLAFARVGRGAESSHLSDVADRFLGAPDVLIPELRKVRSSEITRLKSNVGERLDELRARRCLVDRRHQC